LDPSKSTLAEDHISAPRGVLPLKFLHALENDQGLLAHTLSGTGVPQQFLTINIYKLA